MHVFGTPNIARFLGVTQQSAHRRMATGKLPGAEQVDGHWRLNVLAYRAWLLEPKPKTQTQLKREAVAARQAAREAARAERAEAMADAPDAPDPFRRRDDGQPTPAEIKRNDAFLIALHQEALAFIRSEGTKHEPA